MPRPKKNPDEGTTSTDPASPEMILVQAFRVFKVNPIGTNHLAMRVACDNYAKTFADTRLQELQAEMDAIRMRFSSDVVQLPKTDQKGG